MLLHLDQEKLINYHNKQHDMFLNPYQNLVWAPLRENPPFILDSSRHHKDAKAQTFLNRSWMPGVENSFPRRFSLLMSDFQQLFQSA